MRDIALNVDVRDYDSSLTRRGAAEAQRDQALGEVGPETHRVSGLLPLLGEHAPVELRCGLTYGEAVNLRVLAATVALRAYPVDWMAPMHQLRPCG